MFHPFYLFSKGILHEICIKYIKTGGVGMYRYRCETQVLPHDTQPELSAC